MSIPPTLPLSGPSKRIKPLERTRILFGATIMAILMFFSRILGFFRDLNTAVVMGMSGSRVMDAFVFAFRIPNLFRRLNEEGGLGLSFIPVFNRYLEKDPASARDLYYRFLRFGGLVGLTLVILTEVLIALTFHFLSPRVGFLWNDALHFAAFMAPFLFFTILAALSSATLQGMGRFTVSGMMSPLFNLFWLAALFVVSPMGIYLPFRIHLDLSPFLGVDLNALSAADRGVILSITIVLAAIAQFLIQFFWIRRLLPRPSKNRDFQEESTVRREIQAGIRRDLSGIIRKMIPTLFGLLFLQFNTLIATLLATLFSTPSIPILSHIPGVNALFAETTRIGAASAIYFGERLYEFPLAFIGITIGTAFYPLLSQRVNEKNFGQFADDTSLALRLILTLAIPAGAGLALIASPVFQLFYLHGEFSASDTFRTARILMIFGVGVPAFCLSSLLIRVSYALKDFRRPIRAGFHSTLVFLIVALLLVRPFGEVGLVTAIVVGAWLQTGLLLLGLRNLPSMEKLDAVKRTLRTVLFATCLMIAAILAYYRLAPLLSPDLTTGPALMRVFHIFLILSIGILTYAGGLFILGGRKSVGLLWEFIRSRKKRSIR